MVWYCLVFLFLLREMIKDLWKYLYYYSYDPLNWSKGLLRPSGIFFMTILVKSKLSACQVYYPSFNITMNRLNVDSLRFGLVDLI